MPNGTTALVSSSSQDRLHRRTSTHRPLYIPRQDKTRQDNTGTHPRSRRRAYVHDTKRVEPRTCPPSPASRGGEIWTGNPGAGILFCFFVLIHGNEEVGEGDWQ